jgi:hypothetical protein
MPRPFDPHRIQAVDQDTIEMYRRLPEAERVNAAFDLVEFAWAVVKSGVRAQYPDWDERAVERETDRRFRLASA